MVILFALDLLILLWTFNLLADFGPVFAGTPGGEQRFAAESEPVDRQNNEAKPSPLGRAAGLDLREPAQANAIWRLSNRTGIASPASRTMAPSRYGRNSDEHEGTVVSVTADFSASVSKA